MNLKTYEIDMLIRQYREFFLPRALKEFMDLPEGSEIKLRLSKCVDRYQYLIKLRTLIREKEGLTI